MKRLEIWKFETMVHDHLFAAIAARLPDLRELRLHGMGDVDRFGVGTIFPSAESLGVSRFSLVLACRFLNFRVQWSIATSLSPIKTLRVLAIDVYLTPSTVLLRHASCPRRQALVSCERCIGEFAEKTQTNEIEVSLCIAGALPKLELIEWCSCFIRPCRRRFLCISRGIDGQVSVKDRR